MTLTASLTRAFFVVPSDLERMEQQVVQEFNGESGKWENMPPDPPSEPKVEAPAVEEPETPEPPQAAKDAKTVAEPEKPRNRRDDPKVAVQTAIAKQREAERRAAEAEKRAEEAERRASATRTEPKPEPKVAKAPADSFPSFDKWLGEHPEATDSDDPLRDYNRAFYTHMRDAERKVEAEQREVEQIETSFRTEVNGFSEKYAAAVEADPEVENRINKRLLLVRPVNRMTKADKDYIRSLQSTNPAEADRVAFESFLASRWIKSTKPVEMLEHLSNPQTFQRLVTLPPDEVIAELARFEAGLGAASRAEPAPRPKPPTSKAAPPITPLGSSPHVPDDTPSDEDSDEAWRLKEEARLLRQRRGRG